MKFKKIIFLSVIISSLFILSNITFGSNTVSWTDFNNALYNKWGRDFITTLNLTQNQNIKTQFESDYNNANHFIVFTDWGKTETPATDSETYIYICFSTSESEKATIRFSSPNKQYFEFYFNSYYKMYRMHKHTGAIQLLDLPESIKYNIQDYPQFSNSTWNQSSTLREFLKKMTICTYNMTINWGAYEGTTTYYTGEFIINDFSTSPFPDEIEEPEVQDYDPYFISYPSIPISNEFLIYMYVGNYGIENIKLEIDRVNLNGGLISANTINNSFLNNITPINGMYKFDLKKQYNFQTNSYYKIKLLGKNDVILDSTDIIYVQSSNIEEYNNEKPYIISATNGYVSSSGDVIVTVYIPKDYEYENSIYLTINKYNASGEFRNSNVIGTSSIWNLMNISTGICPIYIANFYSFDTQENYMYEISLNEVQNGILDRTKLFYFETNMTKPAIDNQQKIDNQYNSNLNYDFQNKDFISLINSSKNFLSSFLGFFDIFPSWLNTLIALGLTIAIVCRIIGR